MVFNATLNNISAISWRLVLLMDETGVPGEKDRPVASHWHTFSHVLSSTNRPWKCFELTTWVVKGTDCIVRYKSRYHTITTTMAIIWNVSLLTVLWQFNSNFTCNNFCLFSVKSLVLKNLYLIVFHYIYRYTRTHHP